MQWGSVLQEVFGTPANLLLRDHATLCGTALGCAARVLTRSVDGSVTDDEDMKRHLLRLPKLKWVYVNEGSHGRGFLNTLRQRLPELAQSQMLMDSMEHSLSCTYPEDVSEYRWAIQELEAACSCLAYKMKYPVHRPPHHQELFCQIILVEVIVDLVR